MHACRAHSLPCVKMHACRTHGKPCVNMHASGNVYKWEVIPVRRGREQQKGKEKEKGKGEKGKKERKRRRRKGERKWEKMKSAFRRSELIGPRSKVCIFDEGYAPRGRDSFYFGLFPP